MKWVLLVLIAAVVGHFAYTNRSVFTTRFEPHDPTPEPYGLTPESFGTTLTADLQVRHRLSSLANLQRRAGYTDAEVAEPDEDYDVTQESVSVFVPSSYTGEQEYGLMVWINAARPGAAPHHFRESLGRMRMLWVGANESGNTRKVPVRINLALDGVEYMTRHYKIDENRIYVSGLSGGGKTASHVALLYSEVFRGGLFIVGAEYYRPVLFQDGSRREWLTGFPNPDGRRIAAAKARRFVLLTGETDPNRVQMTDIAAAYADDGFRNVQMVVIPGLGHDLPSALDFEAAIGFLDGSSPTH